MTDLNEMEQLIGNGLKMSRPLRVCFLCHGILLKI